MNNLESTGTEEWRNSINKYFGLQKYSFVLKKWRAYLVLKP